MSILRQFRSTLSATVCLTTLAAAAIPMAGAQAQSNTENRFAIPAGPLGAALNSWTRQTGRQLIYKADEVDARQSPGVNGALSSEAALTALLSGTGFTSKAESSGAIAIIDTRSGESEAGSAAAVYESADIIVTAQRREERLLKVPISITAIGGKQLESSTYTGVSEALNAVPGVTTTQTYLGGGSNITVRGVGASFPFFAGPGAVSYYLDSVPFGLVKSAIGPDASVYDLDRVEVLRGPQGTLYGSSALNGVVRILTHDPELDAFDFKGRASISTTESGGVGYQGDASFNVPIVEDQLAIRATAGYQHNGGWIDQPNRKNANDSDIQTYRVKILGKPTERLSIGLYSWISRSKSGAPDLGYEWNKSASSVDQSISTNYGAFGLKIGYEASSFDITAVSSYLDYKNVGRLGLDVPFFSTPNSLYYTRFNSKILSQEVSANSSSDGPWKWSIGGIYRHGTEDVFSYFTVIPIPDGQYKDKSKSFAGYGQITRLLFDDKFEISGGLRYFHDHITQDGTNAPGAPNIHAESKAKATTPRAVLTWKPNDKATIYASYSQGFRSGFPQSPAIIEAIPDFPSAGPDKLTNYEIGAKGILFDGALAFDASIYHIDWNRIQLQLGVTMNGVPYPAVINGAQARGNGFDLALTFRPVKGLIISPYLSWNDLAISRDVLSAGQALYNKGDRPSNSPKLTAGASATIDFTAGGLPVKLSGSASYVTSQAYRALSGPTLLVQKGANLFVTRASIAVDVAEGWTATIFGNNLNGERGPSAIMFPGVVDNWQARIRPRVIGFQLEYKLHP